MATTSDDARGRIALYSLGGLVLLMVVGAVWYFRPPPQMGADEEVFTTVDALFTAVTGRSEPGLVQCEQRLHALRESGKLPPAAAKRLDAVILQCRSGQWDPAAHRLYDFIKGQRGGA